MGGTVRCDDSRWPVVVVRYKGKVEEADFDESLLFLEKNIRRTLNARSKTVVIFDSTEGETASSKIRQKQADWIKKNFEDQKLGCAGLCFIITSPLVRGILTAILWFSELPAPHTVVSSMAEAEAWAKGQLAPHAIRSRAG